MSERNDNNAVTSTVAVEADRRPEPTSLSERVRSLRLPEQQVKKSSRGIVWLLMVLCLILASTTAGFGYLYFNQPKVEETKASDVSTSSFERRQSDGAHATEIGTVVHESKGNVVPVHQIQVSPKVSGLIVNLKVKKDEKDKGIPLEEGMHVEKNWILAEIEDIDYKADYKRALAALEEANQNLEELTKYRQREIDQAKERWSEADVQRKQLEIDRRRSSKLKNTNALADREFEQADSAYLAMLAREKALRVDWEFMMHGPRDSKIKAAEQRRDQAKEEVVKTKKHFEDCTIRAPIDGTILTKFAEEGNIVNQLSLNLKGSICDMADLSDLEIDLSIQERDVSRVFKGQRCRIRPEAYPDRVYDGYVSRLMPIADRGKGAVPVRVKLIVPKDEEQGAYLKPDMGAVVSFLKKEEGKEAKK
jgi:multidrug resistance efflux pump